MSPYTIYSAALPPRHVYILAYIYFLDIWISSLGILEVNPIAPPRGKIVILWRSLFEGVSRETNACPASWYATFLT